MRRAALSFAAIVLALGAGAPSAFASRVLALAPTARALPPDARYVTQLAGDGVFSLQVPRGTTAGAYARRLRGPDGVLAAQPDQRIRTSQSQVGGFCAAKPSAVDQNAASIADALNTHVSTTPPVAVLDTGVDANVPELSGRLVSPFNALDGSTNTADTDGHGTEVASMAAASPGLFQGISPTSPIMPIKIFGVGGDTSAQILIKAIQRAVSAGAGVINISGANPLSDVDPQDSAIVQIALEDAFAHGVLTVAAAGNEGLWQPDVPEAYPHVISAGSVDRASERSSFSNMGPWLDVMALGQDLTLPAPAGVCPSGYGVANGTSFSAPAVSGAIAILRQLHPKWSAEQITAVLRSSANDLVSPGFDDLTGFGLLDVAAAAAATPPAVDATEPDDDVQWLSGPYASRHPSLLRRSRRASVSASVSPAKDPDDLYPVSLKKGERLSVAVSGQTGDQVVATIWDPATGPFDVMNGKLKHEIVDSGDPARSARLSYRASRTGRYYVEVAAAPVPPGPSDPAAAPPAVPTLEPYQLTLSKRAAPKKVNHTSKRGTTRRTKP